jgi:hypothetical protein
MMFKHQILLIVSLQMLMALQAQVPVQSNKKEIKSFYEKGKLLFKDEFTNTSLPNWVSELPPLSSSSVKVINGKLVIDVGGGATVWLNKKLSGNILITYKRKVVVDTGKNDRLSDLNQFWMATDPRNKNLFTRSGNFAEYDSLLLYYAGFGGNSNTTTRFRKYTGNGERVLYNDLTGKEYLLEANKEYTIMITVYNGVSMFFVDGKEFFSFDDDKPLTEGYFGLRTTQSRQEIDDVEVYALKAFEPPKK